MLPYDRKHKGENNIKNRKMTKLNPKKHYLQVALNSTLEDAREIISQLPISDRIILEAGTPFIKKIW